MFLNYRSLMIGCILCSLCLPIYAQHKMDIPVYPESNDIPHRLMNGIMMHDDELTLADRQQSWLALTRQKSVCKLQPVQLTFQRVFDPVFDEGDEKTGWQSIAHIEDSILTCMPQNLRLPIGEVQPLNAATILLNLNDTFRYQYKDITYKITIVNTKDALNPVYRVQLMWTYHGIMRTEILVEHHSEDQSYVEIYFIGDLDKDGIPDILLNASHHYNVYKQVLYLSSFGDDVRLLKPAAVQELLGC